MDLPTRWAMSTLLVTKLRSSSTTTSLQMSSPESWRYPLHIRSAPPIADSISDSTDPGHSVCSPIQRYNSGLLHFCFSNLRSPSECRIFLNAPLPALPLTGWCCSSFLLPCLLFLRMTVWLFEWCFAVPDLTLSHPLHHILHVFSTEVLWMVYLEINQNLLPFSADNCRSEFC